ncbi:MAG: helix-turn-helix domain-containing protein, partial [Firmicutes bacterium]|nr:helix-turn-helix domain-containing protein [Bacillota bacterium]
KNGHISAIRFSTLIAVCEALNCQPGDILEYAPDAPAEGTPGRFPQT